ncbi:primosomal replication protein N [Neisseria sp.]|uniref:primosomal replication protein N n=1 Tax=Neisseria sp. TaxID=192066 RepID=UPI0035A11DF6
MNNLLVLTARIAKCGTLRYTPAGIPILDLLLKHESWQQENGQQCLVTFEISARILGKDAEAWQFRQDEAVEVTGFLAQRNHRFPHPVLRIQNIQEYKG